MRWNRVAGYARRWRGVTLSVNISHNRRQTEYNQVYLNCWGAKEEKIFLNDTNGHKFILEPSAIFKVLHEFIRSYARMAGAVT